VLAELRNSKTLSWINMIILETETNTEMREDIIVNKNIAEEIVA
jgi:hypothetical protein